MKRELHGSREIVDHSQSEEFTLYVNNESESYSSHWHSELEIAMPLEQEYTIIIDKSIYRLKPYDILIIPSGVSHELIAPESGRRLFLLVRYELLREIRGFASLYNRFFPCMFFPADGSAEHRCMISCLESAIEEHENRHPLWEASIQSCITQFFIQAGRVILSAKEKPPVPGKRTWRTHTETFLQICNYITEHCTQKLSLEDAAKAAGFSRSQFIRLFREYSGSSFYEYLTRQRMTRADILLSEPDLSITEVAMQSGFGSLSTFNRVFRAYHHCTPMEYRHEMRRG